MNIIIYFILFSNILLVNSTFPGENSESNGRGQQNVGQMAKQNEHQPQMEHQFQHLEEDPFSQYYNLLASGNHENEYMDLLQSNSPQQHYLIQAPLADVHLDPQFVDYRKQTEFHSHHGEQNANHHHLPHNLPSGNSMNFDQRVASSSIANEFVDYDDGVFQSQGFEEQQQEEIAGGNEKGNGLSSRAKYEKQRRINYNGILKELRKVLDKCESSFPNLRKGLSKNLKNYKGNITLRGTFSIAYHCIIALENWLIKMESKIIEMENQKKGKYPTPISIEELILNARQNQKILENHPLLFNDHELDMESKMREKTHNEMEAERREKINESLKILLSVFPKGFIIKMTNFLKETIVETIINYIEFLFNLLDPFIGHIWQTKGIVQNEQNMEKVGPESSSRKRQRKGD